MVYYFKNTDTGLIWCTNDNTEEFKTMKKGNDFIEIDIPYSLDDFSYRDLQKKAKNMGIKATGTREEIIERISKAE